MNAAEARKLSNKNGFAKKVNEEIERVERQVKRACEYGRNDICFGCPKNSPVKAEVKLHFRKLGYKFRPTGYNGGVWQETEDMYW
jgi:hypothetical protein